MPPLPIPTPSVLTASTVPPEMVTVPPSLLYGVRLGGVWASGSTVTWPLPPPMPAPLTLWAETVPPETVIVPPMTSGVFFLLT